jgi:hypothetical protein
MRMDKADDGSGLGLWKRRAGTLVRPLLRAKPKLDDLPPLAARHARVRRVRLGAPRPAPAHAFRDGGRARDVGRTRAGVRRRARGRRVARLPHRHGARRAQRHGQVPAAARAGGAGRTRDVQRRAVALGGVAA